VNIVSAPIDTCNYNVLVAVFAAGATSFACIWSAISQIMTEGKKLSGGLLGAITALYIVFGVYLLQTPFKEDAVHAWLFFSVVLIVFGSPPTNKVSMRIW